MKCQKPTVAVTRWDRVRNYGIRRRAGIEETLAEKETRIEDCYDGLDAWNGWMRGAGQESSKQLKWKVNRGEDGLGLVG